MLVDTHCHLDLYRNYQEVVLSINQRGIYCLCVTTTPSAYTETKRRIESKTIKVGLGIHPEVVSSRSHELPLLLELLPKSRYVGEIGVDGSRRFRANIEQQKIILKTILSDSHRHGTKLFSLHSRGAAGVVIEMLKAYPSAGPFLLHWFSGSQSELRKAIDIGCWFSVGPAMLTSQTGRSIAAALPKDRVLTETDGPFTEIDGRATVPSDVSIVLDFYAKLWHLHRDEVENIIFTNFKKTLSLLPAI